MSSQKSIEEVQVASVVDPRSKANKQVFNLFSAEVNSIANEVANSKGSLARATMITSDSPRQASKTVALKSSPFKYQRSKASPRSNHRGSAAIYKNKPKDSVMSIDFLRESVESTVDRSSSPLFMVNQRSSTMLRSIGNGSTQAASRAFQGARETLTSSLITKNGARFARSKPLESEEEIE